MYSQNLLLAICLIICINLNSQTGPGGVGNSSSNGLWLKANDIPQPSGTNINTWLDASGNNNNATAISGEQPIFVSNSSLNNMPSVRLDGIDDQMIINDADILDDSSGLTFFAVLRPSNLNGSTPRGILGKRIAYTVSTNYAYTWFFWGNNYLNADINTHNQRFNTNPTSFSNNTNYIFKLGFNGSLPLNERAHINNAGSLVTLDDESSTSIINSNANLVIGALNHNYGSYLGADYAEVIHFNKDLNLAEEIIVNNYLSAKYNIALTSNDFYSKDNSSNGNFDYYVAGIGQASDGSSHTDSQGSGIVRINTPRDLDNDEFLFWGESSQNATYSFSKNTTTHTEQLNSVWRIDRRGDLGNVDIYFDLNNIDLTGKQNCQSLQLIVDNDSNFSLTDSNDEVYNLTISGTTATATNVILRDNSYFTLRYTDEIVWDGTNFHNGSGIANAPTNSDSCLKLTVKPGASSILNIDAHVREIIVETGAFLHVANGVDLQVENNIIVNGEIDLLGEAQLIQNHSNTSTNSGSGFLVKRQQGTSNLYNYNYWSSPVNTGGFWQIGNLEDINGTINFTNNHNADHTTTPITLSQRWLYEFNGLTSTYSEWKRLSTTSNLAPGIGFTMKGSGTAASEQEYLFKGIPNDGNYSFSVTAGNNLLTGNPYPSALDADQFITDNLSSIDGSIYFWEHFSSNNSHYLASYEGGYATYNLLMALPATADASGLTSGLGSTSKALPTSNIPVGQGFFISVINNGSLVYNNQQRAFAKESLAESVHYKNNDKKSSKVDSRTKIWFSLTDPNQIRSIIGLGYDKDNASSGYDNGYDAKVHEDKNNDVFWKTENENLIIQALSEINIEDELPLTLKVSTQGIFKFAINNTENVPKNTSIFLKDNSTNTYYDLTKESAQLYLLEDIYENQFSIVFQEEQSLSLDNYKEKALSVFYDKKSKNIVFNNLKNFGNGIKGIKLYNSIGQEIITLNSLRSNSINAENLSNGVYIVNVYTNNTVKTAKVLKF